MRKQAGMRLRLPAALAALTCVLALAACGGSSPKHPPAAVPVPATSGSVPPTTTQTAPPSTTATTTSTSQAAPPPCVTADFTLRLLGQEGATGHGELGFALRNLSSQQCRTAGYPGVLFLDKAGNALPTSPTHTTVDFFGKTSDNELVVLPGASVSFRLGVNHEAANGGTCTTAYGLQVIVPNDTHTSRVTIPQGAYECGGDVTVSPLQAAELAFTQ